MNFAKINSKGQKFIPKETTYKYLKRFFQLLYKIVVILVVESFKSLLNFFKKIEPKNIEGQLALVTGGGNGLGKEICIELAKRGCNVAIIDIDLPGATKTAELLKTTYGVKAKGYKTDVSSYNEILELKPKIEKDLGFVDIIMNNAGITPTKTLDECSPEFIKTIIDVNLLSNIWTVKVFLPGMKERKCGHIVQIASLAGMTGVPIAAVYSASKFGVRGFMDSIFLDMVTENLEDVIHTTTVFPYFIATNDELCNFLEKNRYLNFFPAYKASDVAKITVDGFLKNQRKIIIPNFFDYVIASQRYHPEAAEIQIQKLLLNNATQYKKNKNIENNEIDYNQNVTKVSSQTLLCKTKNNENIVENFAEKVVDNLLGDVVENVMEKVIENVVEN